ncbi:hypothetical protein TNCV_4145291 [Trichonephila clavipes]|nr:hypothetical protein TNCV_4145291 [Trichonephila clavipes]
MPNNHTIWPFMTAVDCLHHENPPSWAVVEPATLGADGQIQTNYATQSALTKLENGQRFIFEMLEPVTIPYIQRYLLAVFQQDNELLYVAHIVQEFFTHNIELLPWPGYSSRCVVNRKIAHACTTTVVRDTQTRCNTRPT